MWPSAGKEREFLMITTSRANTFATTARSLANSAVMAMHRSIVEFSTSQNCSVAASSQVRIQPSSMLMECAEAPVALSLSLFRNSFVHLRTRVLQPQCILPCMHMGRMVSVPPFLVDEFVSPTRLGYLRKLAHGRKIQMCCNQSS